MRLICCIIRKIDLASLDRLAGQSFHSDLVKIEKYFRKTVKNISRNINGSSKE